MDDAEVEARLLAHLRAVLERPSLEYARRPERFAWGVDATLYAFELANAPAEVSGPLVLRLFPRDVLPERARREAAVQRAVSRLGYPAPAAHLWGQLGEDPPQAFLVMDRLPGRTFLSVVMWACAAAITASVFGAIFSWFAVWALYVVVMVRWMRRLHGLPVARVREELAAAGVPPDALGMDALCDALEARITRVGATGLLPGVAWLRAQPLEPGPEVMCHGDFWPGNVLFGAAGVTGVIDWGEAAVAPREFELAWSQVAYYSGLGVQLPEPVAQPMLRASRPLVWGVLSLYRVAYAALQPLDPARMRYFTAVHCIRVLVYAAERRALDALEPDARGAHPWTDPEVVAAVERRFELTTDVPIACAAAAR